MTVYYKMRQILLQNVTVLLQDAIVITKCDNFITKWDSYYKTQRLLEIATVQLIMTVQNQSTFSSEYLVFFFLRHFYLSTSTLFNFSLWTSSLYINFIITYLFDFPLLLALNLLSASISFPSFLKFFGCCECSKLRSKSKKSDGQSILQAKIRTKFKLY